ncbi:unnamed protein product [marine sediment metagenome]|uniref:Uncharacterized protein n=1 Tax=marine sediment metagenome TaxID=412755 RepID=X1LI51_9ZZZZ
MGLGFTKNDRMDVRTKGGGFKQIGTVFNPLTDNGPHTDTVVDPRLSEVAFNLGLEPEGVEDSDTAIDTVIPTTPVATMKQAHIHTVPSPLVPGDTLGGNTKDTPVGTLAR